jgi:hypothetical protein
VGCRVTLGSVRQSRSPQLALFSSNNWSEETRQVTISASLGDDRVPEIVEAQALQPRGVAQRAPGRVPLQHRLGGIEPSPLAGGPLIVLGRGVVEHVGALEHPRERIERRRVQPDDAVARLVLAPAHVQELLDQIDIAAPEVLDLDVTHRRVRCHDRLDAEFLRHLNTTEAHTPSFAWRRSDLANGSVVGEGPSSCHSDFRPHSRPTLPPVASIPRGGQRWAAAGAVR